MHMVPRNETRGSRYSWRGQMCWTKYILLTPVFVEDDRRELGERTPIATCISEKCIKPWKVVENTYSSGRL